MSGRSATAGPRGLTLDLWHTLVYLEPDAEEEYMQAQLDLGASVLAEAPPRGPGAVEDIAELRAAFAEAYASAVSRSQRGVSVTPAQQLAEAGARVLRDADPDEYLRRLDRLVSRTRFLRAPGVLEELDRLRADGWRTAVISNTVGEPGRTLRPQLTALGFDPRLDAFVFSDEQPWTKPAPEIFRYAVDRLGVLAERTVHVGDGWSDVEGARRAGFRAAVLYTGLQRYGRRYHRLFLPPGAAEPATPYRMRAWEELSGLLQGID